MRLLLVFLCAIGILSFGVEYVSAQDSGTAIVKQTLGEWEKRRKAIRSVTYQTEGTEIYAKGSLTDPDPSFHPNLRKQYPPKDVSFPKKITYAFDFPSGRIRKEERHSILNAQLGEFHPRTAMKLFNGSNATIYTPANENTSTVYTPSARQPELTLYKGGMPFLLGQWDYPLLYAHGSPPLYNKRIDESKPFMPTLDPLFFRMHQKGTIGDRPCVILRTIPEAGRFGKFDEFWVDLERHGAILRWQGYSRGAAYIRHDIVYGLVDGHWLPRSWQFDLFPGGHGKQDFLRREHMNVTEVQINPPLPDSLFIVDPENWTAE